MYQVKIHLPLAKNIFLQHLHDKPSGHSKWAGKIAPHSSQNGLSKGISVILIVFIFKS